MARPRLWERSHPLPTQSTNIAGIKRARSLRNFEPHQLGKDADWAKIMQSPGNSIFGWKRNGQAWLIHHYDLKIPMPRSAILLAPSGWIAERLPEMDNRKFRSLAYCGSDGLRAAVAEDGSLWTWKMTWHRNQGAGRTLSITGPVARIGTETNWSMVASGLDRLVALKEDGSMHQWQVGWRETAVGLAAAAPTRMGTHQDWVAISTEDWRGIISLAADGGLWYWWNRDSYNNDNHADFGQPMLENSRRPEFIANIFSAKESGARAGTIKN